MMDVLESDARIPYVHEIGGRLYNFWTDAEHVRGIWRRTTRESYEQSDATEWETVVDVDALGKEEGVSWVWKGVSSVVEPTQDRVLLSLSDGGGDAVVVREFDLSKKKWVTVAEGGFVTEKPTKINISYKNRDSVYVGM